MEAGQDVLLRVETESVIRVVVISCSTLAITGFAQDRDGTAVAPAWRWKWQNPAALTDRAAPHSQRVRNMNRKNAWY